MTDPASGGGSLAESGCSSRWKRCLVWRNGIKTEAEIGIAGMRALISALGLLEAERLMVAVSRDRFNHAEGRRQGLPGGSLELLAQQANRHTEELNVKQGKPEGRGE